MEVLEFIKMISDMGLKSTGGLSNNSNGMPKHIRPIMDSATGSYGYDERSDLRNRKPERPETDGDHQVLRYHQEQQSVRRFLS